MKKILTTLLAARAVHSLVVENFPSRRASVLVCWLHLTDVADGCIQRQTKLLERQSVRHSVGWTAFG